MLPFGGHSGYMGSDASRERAECEDEMGVTEWRQRQVLELLAQAGPLGMTYREIGERLNWHHGQSTGTLSPMHGAGLIVALADTRDNCTVYVLPGHVGERAVREYGGGKAEVQRLAIENLKTQLATANASIERLERDAAEANGNAEQANAQLLPVAREMERLSERVLDLEGRLRHRGEVIELHEQTIAAKDVTIRTLETQISALRISHHLVGLDPEEQALAESLLRALEGVRDLPDDATRKIRVSSLRTFAGIAKRLMVSAERESGRTVPEVTEDSSQDSDAT